MSTGNRDLIATVDRLRAENAALRVDLMAARAENAVGEADTLRTFIEDVLLGVRDLDEYRAVCS